MQASVTGIFRERAERSSPLRWFEKRAYFGTSFYQGRGRGRAPWHVDGGGRQAGLH